MPRHIKGVSSFTLRYKATGHWAQTKRRRKRKYKYFKARVMIDGKAHFLGHFATAEEAGKAYVAGRARLLASRAGDVSATSPVQPSPAE